MSILLIGSTGFIGKYYSTNTRFHNVFETSREKKRKYIKFDITKNSIEEIINLYNIKKVVFFVSISNPDKCEAQKDYSTLVNVTKTKQILNFLIKKNIYFIFFSSEYVFDGKKGNYKENSKKKSNLLYGKQKIAVENYLRTKKKNNFAVLRISKTFGVEPGDNSLFTNFLDKAKAEKATYVASDQYFSALYVKDLIKIIDIFLKKKIKGTYNVCGDEKYSRYEFLLKLISNLKLKNKLLISPKKFSFFSNNKNIPLNVTMNNSKIKNKINFKFKKISTIFKLLKLKYR